MKKVFLLISLVLIISVLGVGVAFASNSPEVIAKYPTNDTYLVVDSPVLTTLTSDKTVVVDQKADGYHLITLIDGVQTDINIGNEPIDSICVYGNYAILCTANNGQIIVCDLSNGIVDVTGFPSGVYSITLTGSTLYTQTATVSAYDLTNINNGEVTLIKTYDSEQLFKVQYGIFTDGNNVYYTKKTGNLSTIYAYDVTNDTAKTVCEIENMSDFVVSGEYLYAITSNSSKLLYYHALSNTHGEINLKHNAPVDICVYDDIVALTHTTSRAIDVYQIGTGTPVYASTLCSDSNLPRKFNSPRDVYNNNGIVAVADYNNDRVQIFTDTGVNIIKIQAPVSVAISDFTAVATNSTINIYSSTNSVYTSADGVDFNGLDDIAIDTNGTIYAIDRLNARVVYKTSTSSEFRTFINSAPHSLAIAPHGSVVYCVYANVIYAYDNGAREIFKTTIPTLNSATASVDATGTMFILSSNQLYTLNRSLNGYTIASTDTLNFSEDTNAKITISDDGEVLLVDGVRHQVFELTGTSARSYTPNTDDTGVYNKVNIDTAVKLVTVSNDTFIYDNKDNYETTRIVKQGTTLVLLSNEPVGDFYYVYCGAPCFLPVNQVGELSIETREYDAIALHQNTGLYKYPILSDAFKLTTVGKEASFKVISTVGDFTHDNAYWSQIEYQGNIYYITRNNIGLAPLERIEDHGVAKLRSSIVGQKIKVYSLADDKSSVIGEYADGTEVQLLDEIDDASTFTRVQIGDVVGFVRTNELTQGGLTTAQLVILLLILLGGTASVTILVISRKMYKRR